MKLDVPTSGRAARSPLRVVEINPQRDPRWEALVTNLPNSQIHHHPAWLQVQEEAYHYKPLHLACEDASGNLLGILPLFYRRLLTKGNFIFGSSPLVTDDPLVDNDQVRAELVQSAIERISAEPRTKLILTAHSNALDRLVEGMVRVPAYETYLLALPVQPDLLHFDARIKWAVNKARRLGVHIRQAHTESDLQSWYELYLQTMRKLLVVPKPYHFFELAWQQLRPRGLLRLLLAERGEAGQSKLLSGFLFLLWGQTIHHTFTGWQYGERALRPNDAIHWQAIHDACTDGFRWYDFGDISGGTPGLAPFKRKWGAEEKMLYHYIYPQHTGGTSVLRTQSKRFTRQLVHTVWPHVPLKMTALLGDWSHAIHYY